jgi:hypothetical protein
VWPGHPVTAHWGVPDPAAVEGDLPARKAAFRSAFDQLERRIRCFADLCVSETDGLSLEKAVAEIGKAPTPRG